MDSEQKDKPATQLHGNDEERRYKIESWEACEVLLGMAHDRMSSQSRLHKVVWIIPKVIESFVIVGSIIPDKIISI